MSETALGTVIGNLARVAPHRAALTCGMETISWAELEARTNRLARAYRELGVTPDSFVTVGLPNGNEFFESVLAVWKLGATPQPVSSRLPAAERRAIIDLANPSLVVGVDPSETPGRTTIRGGFQPEATLSSDPLPPLIGASFKAPTSGGSTGRPKLIVATQSATWESVEGFAHLLMIPPDRVHPVDAMLLDQHQRGHWLQALHGHYVIAPMQ